jgi:serine/threonine/tyrosine-interacting protein
MINTHVARHRLHALQHTGRPALGKALVFCESGNEKAAAVVAAYLMETLADFDHVKAMQVCQAQRFCVNFDDTLKNMLRSYCDILQAQRSVASSNSASAPITGFRNGAAPHGSTLRPQCATKQKRTIESTREDEDVDMDISMDPSDALRFMGRDSTPFQNRYQ